MKITEINSIIKSVEYAGERFINIRELDSFLKNNYTIKMEECLITPYYIQDNKRMELYQYEFCCTNELDFENYLLKITGKEKVADVPEEILFLKRKCFSTYDDSNSLVEFIKFLYENKTLKEEIKQAFGEYIQDNLFVVIY